MNNKCASIALLALAAVGSVALPPKMRPMKSNFVSKSILVFWRMSVLSIIGFLISACSGSGGISSKSANPLLPAASTLTTTVDSGSRSILSTRSAAPQFCAYASKAQMCVNNPPPPPDYGYISYLANALAVPANGFSYQGCAESGSLGCYDHPLMNGVPKSELACEGLPSGCAGVPCSASPETITDFLGSNTVQVKDINGVWFSSNGGQVGGAVIGWMYLASNGIRYFQPNFANRAAWGASFTAQLLLGFGISVAQPGGYGSIAPWNGTLTPGAHLVKCESRGGVLA